MPYGVTGNTLSSGLSIFGSIPDRAACYNIFMYMYQGTDLIAKAESYLVQAESALNGIEGPHDPQMSVKLDLVETLSTLAGAFLELNEAFEELDDEAEEDQSTMM